MAHTIALAADAPAVDRSSDVLTLDALEFVATLHDEFRDAHDELLARRRRQHEEIERTGRLDFLPWTAPVRGAEWTVAPAPADLLDRRVEITGPPERKMAINALNSGARVWLADLEDANSPTWENIVSSQVNLFDAIRRTLAYTGADGRQYALRTDAPLATIVMRPRGWHLPEGHLVIGDRPAIAALVDFGLYFFHNARELLARGSGPYFYLPKMEGHLEARLCNEVFVFASERLGIPSGTIRATVLIETISAAFEMDEILFELREHASGLNAGRWDYLFSLIKNFRSAGPDFVLPDRAAVTMTAPMMRAYTDLLVTTCHRRGAHAIGGMAAFIPSRRDPEVNERALAQVRADKDREAAGGFDGSWVAHPDLVPVCDKAFSAVLGDRSDQRDLPPSDAPVSAAKLLDVKATPGEVTEAGVRNDVAVGVRYLAAWLGGLGAVGVFNLMEDVATAEIARSQLWQWRQAAVTLPDGRKVTDELIAAMIADEVATIRRESGAGAFDRGHYADAARLLSELALDDEFVEFLTFRAYDLLP